MTKTIHTLDFGSLFQLELDLDPEKGTLSTRLGDHGNPWPRFRQAIADQLTITPLGVLPAPTKTLTANGLNASFDPMPRDFLLQLKDQVIGHYQIDDHGKLTNLMTRQLTSSDTRRIGTFHDVGPYSQRRDDLTEAQNNALLEKAQGAVTTDFHTHSSGQISAEGLLDIALQHDAYYPLSLLQEAEINISKFKHTNRIPRVIFPPVDGKKKPEELSDKVVAAPLHDLSPEDLKKLAIKMSLPADQQATFYDLEYDAYRFRYPLTKNPALLKDTWMKVAEEYAKHGVNYAEITFVGLENPELFSTLHEILPEIQKKYGVTFRYMVGIPRQWSIDKVRETLDKAKVLSASPYMVGVDLIGYEMNKTKEFKKIFRDFADWANKERPGFTLKAHAGENEKNLDNVVDYLEILDEFPNLRGRIGHGIYGMNERAMKLARKIVHENPDDYRLVFEYNPASNIALNNINDVKDLPFTTAIEDGIPFVVGSDSGGIYHTDARQLGMDTYFAGLTSNHFDLLIKHQQKLVERQNAYAKTIEKRFPGWDKPLGLKRNIKQIIGELAHVVPEDKSLRTPKPSHEEVAEALRERGVVPLEPGVFPPELKRQKDGHAQNKIPIAIVGASGSSWKRMNAADRRESAIMTDMLAHALNPDEVYFVHGREKESGLSKVMIDAVTEAERYHNERGRSSIANVGLLADPNFNKKDSYTHLSHMQQINGDLVEVATSLVDHIFDNHGIIIAAGGAAFTGDIINVADRRGIRDTANDNRKMMLLLSSTEGASQEKAKWGASHEKAKWLHPDYNAPNAKVVIEKLHAQLPHLFAPGFNIDKLDEYYAEAANRIKIKPNIDGHEVVSGQTISQSRGRGVA